MKNEKEIGLTVRQLRGEMSLRDFAKKCAISHTTIDNIEKGVDFRTGKPTQVKMSTLQKIASACGVPLSHIIGGDSNETNSLPFGLFAVSRRRFPLVGEIACGKPILTSEEHETYVDASADIQADFCLRAKGDSMTGARILDGDIVFIREQPMVNNGEIAAVIIDNEATLKRVYYYPERQKLVLNPENPKYEPLVYVGEELNTVRILGKAVCFMSNLS